MESKRNRFSLMEVQLSKVCDNGFVEETRYDQSLEPKQTNYFNTILIYNIFRFLLSVLLKFKKTGTWAACAVRPVL